MLADLPSNRLVATAALPATYALAAALVADLNPRRAVAPTDLGFVSTVRTENPIARRQLSVFVAPLLPPHITIRARCAAATGRQWLKEGSNRRPVAPLIASPGHGGA